MDDALIFPADPTAKSSRVKSTQILSLPSRPSVFVFGCVLHPRPLQLGCVCVRACACMFVLFWRFSRCVGMRCNGHCQSVTPTPGPTCLKSVREPEGPRLIRRRPLHVVTLIVSEPARTSESPSKPRPPRAKESRQGEFRKDIYTLLAQDGAALN